MEQRRKIKTSDITKENTMNEAIVKSLNKQDINSLINKNKNLTQNVVYRYIRAKIKGIASAKMVTLDDVKKFLLHRKDSIADKNVHLIFLPFLLKNRWMMGVFLCGQIYMVNVDRRRYSGIKPIFNRAEHDRWMRQLNRKYAGEFFEESEEEYVDSVSKDSDSGNLELSLHGSFISHSSEYTDDIYDDEDNDSYICNLGVSKNRKNLDTIRDVLKFSRRKNKHTRRFHADYSRIEAKDSGVYICKMVDHMIEQKFYDKKEFSKDVHERHEILPMSFDKIEENTQKMKEYKKVIREFLQK